MKKKFITAWMIAILLPLFLFTTLIHFQGDALENPINRYLQIGELNSVEKVSREINQFQLNGFDNKNLIDLFNKYEKNNTQIGFIYRNDGEILYHSDFINSIDEIKNTLPKYNEIIDYGNEKYFEEYDLVVVRQIDIKDKKTIFILRNVSGFNPVMMIIAQNILYFLLVMLLFYTIFKYKLAKSIMDPINDLIDMTQEVKKGNLDVKVEESIKDTKIKDLIISFNDMVKGLKEAKEIRNMYEENQREFIMNITHDLKTPLTSIKLHVEALKDGVIKTDEKKKEYFDNIIKKTKDIDYLINEISLYSKLNLKKMIFNIQPVKFYQIFDELMEEIKFEYDNKGVKIDYNIEIDRNQKVLMDIEKIKRVILNAFENAYKYSKSESLHLNVLVDDYNENFIKVEIADNGVGVDPDKLNRIFDRFYREDKSRTSGKSGSGLGLCIASEIIDNHEGKIWARLNDQKGLSVVFTLLKAGDHSEENTNN